VFSGPAATATINRWPCAVRTGVFQVMVDPDDGGLHLKGGMSIVVGPTGRRGEAGLVESTDGHQQPPDQQQQPQRDQRRTGRLEGVRSWRWMSGLGCLSGDLGQLIPTSTVAALR
jgi:hypothetical protein